MDSINNASSLGSDAWLELQAFKTRQINRREKLNRHKDLINGIATNQVYPQQTNAAASSSHQATINDIDSTHRTLASNIGQDNLHQLNNNQSHNKQNTNESTLVIEDIDLAKRFTQSSSSAAANDSNSDLKLNNISNSPPTNLHQSANNSKTCENKCVNIETVECLLLLKLCDVALKLPIDSKSLQRSICRVKSLENTSQAIIENLLEKFAHQELITIEVEPSATAIINKRKNITTNLDGSHQNDETSMYVISADHTKLVEFDKTFGSSDNIRALLSETRAEDTDELNLFATNEQNGVIIQNVRNSSSGTYESKDRNDNLTDHRQHDQSGPSERGKFPLRSSIGQHIGHKTASGGDDLESLLSLSSTREKESKKLGEELLELLSKPTAKERNLLERFRSADGYQVQEFCPRGTKDECRRFNKEVEACSKLHFKKIIAKHTEESLGDCSFLNTCFHMDSCKYVHYEVDYDDKQMKSNSNRGQQQQQQQQQKQNHSSETRNKKSSASLVNQNNFAHPSQMSSSCSSKSALVVTSKGSDELDGSKAPSGQTALDNSKLQSAKFTLSAEERARIEARNRKRFKTVLYPPQWIQCDLRYFDMSLLGKFSVIMADPPWDIHMELPYGTMSDDEMRKLNIPTLQDEGVIFLWVTGRAMELGRECLALWGYERCDEIIWVKTNQLQRIIRTGRTGHWLNHGKEHCLVGIKGNPTTINRGLDCDIIVAEVRATSHKPDEIYGIIERLSPGTRKIELFGRAHNVQPNWITLGNQLNGVKLVEPDLIEAFKKLDMPYHTSDEVT